MVGGWIASYVFILIFGLGAAAAAAHKISTEAERGTVYCFFLLRFCPLHCDASDVYCCCSWLLLFLSFRVQCFGWLLTALLLRRDACWKNTCLVPAKGCKKVGVHLYFLVEACLYKYEPYTWALSVVARR